MVLSGKKSYRVTRSNPRSVTYPRKDLYDGCAVFIFTHLGTRVYFDRESRQLKHGDTNSVPFNVFFVPCGAPESPSNAGLFVFAEEGDVQITTLATLEDSNSECVFEFYFLSQDRIYLKSRAFYLSAEHDGSLNLRKPWRGGWEIFRVAYVNADCDPSVLTPEKLECFAAKIRKKFPVGIRKNVPIIQAPVQPSKKAVICNINWLRTYLTSEHLNFVEILRRDYGFDIINSIETDFGSESVITELNTYDVVLVAWQGKPCVPLNILSAFRILKIDDLTNDQTYTEGLSDMVRSADMIIGPYAYEIHKYFPHRNIKWVPYSSDVLNVWAEVRLNEDPVPKILLSGSVAKDRPFREWVFSIDDDRLVKLAHPGYWREYTPETEEVVGWRWYATLNKYLCAFCDAHSLRYIHLRVFEIVSVGTLLLADRLVEHEMNMLGFYHKQTCIFCDKFDFLDTVSWILDERNRRAVDEIRKAGMALAMERHTTKRRVHDFVELLNDEVETK